MKPVVKISESGEVIHRYSSIAEAARRNGVHPSGISKSLKGRNRSAGYYWDYDIGQIGTAERIGCINFNEIKNVKDEMDQR